MLKLLLCLEFCALGQSVALPNIIFVLTDDQDLTLGSMNYMNKTIDLVANKGAVFTNFFANNPICCPSRSTILTGRYAHNVQVFNNSLNGGCSSQRWQQGPEKDSIASILKSQKGYNTFYAGKYLNQYGCPETGGIGHVPLGYDWWLGLEGNSKYYNYTLSINGTGQFFENDYLTDKIANYALAFLNQMNAEEPFYMTLAVPAAHDPFTPAPRHQDWFPDLKTVRTPPFNVTPVNKHWVVDMPPTSLPEDVSVLDEIYRNRIRSLQSVDEMVEAVISKLDEMDVLSNTFIIVSSDQGYHIGQFTQPWDKRQPYESDIRAPFIIRGPGIPTKSLSEYPISTIDIAPTIWDLAGITAASDGKSFKKQLFAPGSEYEEKYIAIEYWGEANPTTVEASCPWSYDLEISQCTQKAWCKCQDSRNNTYNCVLKMTPTSRFKCCLFEGTFVEAYDLIADPYELNNLGMDKDRVQGYLDIVKKMERCRGPSCNI